MSDWKHEDAASLLRGLFPPRLALSALNQRRSVEFAFAFICDGWKTRAPDFEAELSLPAEK